MSKGQGQKITVKFTEELVGDVTGLIPKPIATGDYFRPIGAVTGSSQYSSYAPSRAFDGNVTGSYWYTRTTGDQWVQVQLSEPIFVSGFRWYIGSSYRPNGFILQGSNNGTDWDNIQSENSPNATGWHEFSFGIPEVAYQYYRWTVTSRHSSYLYIYEIELRGTKGQEGAFKVTGQEYKYINGPLLDKEYQIVSVENHPTVDKALLLTMHPLSRFPTVEGSLTVEYDASVGTLAGRGGPVENFIETFTPTDLVPEPNPGIEESVTVAPAGLNVDFIPIAYIDTFAEETDLVTVAPAELTVELLHTSVINP